MEANMNGDEAQINITAAKVSETQTAITARLGAEVLLVDKLDVSRHKSRAEFIDKLCSGRPGINAKEIEALLLELAAKQSDPEDKPAPSGPSREDLLEEMTPLARQQAREMLEDPQLVKRIVDDIGAVGVAGEKELACIIYMIGSSRLLPRPLAGIVQGPSSSGKSFTIEKSASLFPPEAVLMATQMTPQALFYMAPGSLSHRFIVAGERSRAEDDETAEATRALREMISSGKLTKLVPLKIEGKMETQVIEQEGPIAFVESTTLADIFDEDLNRCILLSTDERQTQTRNIINSIAAKFASNGASAGKQIIDRHHALQRMIEPLSVLVPFAPRLAEHFPEDRVEARRAFPHVLALIQASALLHQFQRKRNEDNYLLADHNDYHFARHLMAGPLGRQLGGGIGEPARRFYDKIEALVGGGQFTAADIARRIKAGERSVRGWLAELEGVGVAQIVEAHKGAKAAIWELSGTIGDTANILPATQTIFPEVT